MTGVSELQSHVYQTLWRLREPAHVCARTDGNVNMSRIPEPSSWRICLTGFGDGGGGGGMASASIF